MKRSQIISYFFIALLLFVMYQLFLVFSPFVNAIFWAAILAFGFYPMHAWLQKRIPKREGLAASLTTAVIMLIVLPPVVLVVANIAKQAIEFYQIATVYIREGHLEKLIDDVRSFPMIKTIENKFFEWDPFKESAKSWVLNSSKAVTNFSVAQVGTVTKNIFFISINAVLTAFLVFVFLKDGRMIYEFIYQVAPLEEGNKRFIFKQLNETFAAVIRGQILTSLTQAVIAGTIFWALGLPLPIFFAIATFMTSLIPVLGATAVWLPLSIYLVVQQAFLKAFILFICGVLFISLVDNVMKPALIGEKTKLPYFLLFFGILGGLKVYGLMGVFLAPVVLSLFFTMIKIYQEKFT